MKLLSGLLLLFSLLPARAMAMEIKTDYFSLDLPAGWEQAESDDAEQWIFRSRRGQLTVSVVHMAAQPEDLERIANKLLEMRFDAEVKFRQNSKTTQPWGTEHPDGTLQVNYLGRDDTDTFFFYSGYVMPHGTLSLTGELVDSNQGEIEAFFQEVLAGFRY